MGRYRIGFFGRAASSSSPPYRACPWACDFQVDLGEVIVPQDFGKCLAESNGGPEVGPPYVRQPFRGRAPSSSSVPLDVRSAWSLTYGCLQTTLGYKTKPRLRRRFLFAAAQTLASRNDILIISIIPKHASPAGRPGSILNLRVPACAGKAEQRYSTQKAKSSRGVHHAG